MPASIVFPSGGHFNGPLSATQFFPPAASVNNAAIIKQVGNEIEYDKLEHLFPIVYNPSNRQQRLTLRSPIFDLTNSTGQSLVLLAAQQAITILEARIVYDDGSTASVTDGSIKLGTAADGAQIAAATSFENSKAAGEETAITLADDTLDAGSVIHLTYAAPASGSTGEAHLELDYKIDAAADEPLTESPLIHIARKAGAVKAIEAVMATVPSSSSTVTIDLKKSTGAAAFATILTAALELDSGSTNRTAEAGTINSPDYVAGDLLQLEVTVAGAIGTRGAGLAVVIWCAERP